MLDFMKRHPFLAFTTHRISESDAKRKRTLLDELTLILNNCSDGVTKSPDQWLKVGEKLLFMLFVFLVI